MDSLGLEFYLVATVSLSQSQCMSILSQGDLVVWISWGQG